MSEPRTEDAIAAVEGLRGRGVIPIDSALAAIRALGEGE